MMPRELARRIMLGAAIGVVATVMYHGTQYLGAPHARLRETCWSWQWVPFHPAWFWPYVSLFVLLGVPWFTLTTWEAVKRFAAILVSMAAVGWAGFLLYPTACVRPAGDVPAYLARLYDVDWPNNCFPCLHSALAVFGAYGVIGRASWVQSLFWRYLIGGWTVLILISIVALRQHTGMDEVAGLVLGTVAAWVFRRTARERLA